MAKLTEELIDPDLEDFYDSWAAFFSALTDLEMIIGDDDPVLKKFVEDVDALGVGVDKYLKETYGTLWDNLQESTNKKSKSLTELYTKSNGVNGFDQRQKDEYDNIGLTVEQIIEQLKKLPQKDIGVFHCRYKHYIPIIGIWGEWVDRQDIEQEEFTEEDSNGRDWTPDEYNASAEKKDRVAFIG